MRRFFLLCGLVVSIVFGAAGMARAQDCMALDVDAAAGHAGELTTLLKIANFRADVKYMGEVATELEQFLTTCGDEATGRLAIVCDFDCHLQLGRYRLFLAADMPFLSSASGVSRNDTPVSPQSAQEFGRQGIEIVDRGLRILARQQGGDQGTAAGEDASYRTFVRQLTALSSLKIQLLMNTGDVWYQTVSEARVKALDFLVNDTLGAVGGAGLDSQPNLSKAYTNYEAAMWVLVETQMDIPGESTYDDLRADLLLQQSDLDARMDSVRKGFLFLNIDPMQFTTIPFEELQQALAESEQRLTEVERNVEALVERWYANKEGEATRALDEERTIRSQEVNLIAHKIGKLEHEAQTFATTVQQEINAVDAEKDTFGYRQQIRSLEIELGTKIAEFENQRRQINDRQELDLIVLSKEAEVERRNELRWLLNWEMTQMNLDLQISSLESQITEYARQTERNANQLEQAVRQRQILQTQITNNQGAIARANDTITELQLRQTDLYQRRRAVDREQLCGIENQLALIGDTADHPFTPLLAGEQPCQTVTPAFTRNQYVAQMCGPDGQSGLRAQLLNSQTQAKAFLMKCVIGSADFADVEPLIADQQMITSNISLPQELANVDCGSFSQTETDFAKKLYEAERDLYAKRKADLEEARDQVDGQLSEVIAWFVAFNGTTQAAQVILTSVQGAYSIGAAVPEIITCACGLGSGVATVVDVAKPIRAALEAAQSILSTIINTGQITQANINEINALKQRLTQLRQAIGQLDLDKALKARALVDTHFQLAGRLAQGAQDIKELALQGSMAAVDCQSQDLSIDEQVARLKSDHERILAGLDLQARENDLLSFQITDQQRTIDRLTNEIAILNLELDKLSLSEAQLNQDNARVAELVAATNSRIDRVRAAQTTVTGLAEESNASTNLINELRDRQKDKMLALNDAELAFVEQRITQSRGNTEELVAGLNQAKDLGLKSRALQDSILKFQSNVQAEVTKQQEDMTKLVTQIDDPATRKNLFIATQDTVADLMKGIPEYLVTKRRVLETANRLMHLMRRRFEVVQAFTGEAATVPMVYVRNATQLQAMIDDIVAKRFFDERQINIDVAQIVVPANSGFARKLALDENVEFEVSPFASTEALMKANGYFALWAPNKFRERKNLTLIDVFAGTDYQCTGAQWNRFALQHRGSGLVFKPLTKGSSEVSADISVGPERVALQTFFNQADSGDEINRIIRYWVQDRYQARKFPRAPGPSNDTSLILPYLGAPLIGSYRLSLQPSDCPFDGAVFTLYFIFASAP
ncbi:hypothetical protein EFV37_31190 [Mesorhizobium loti]|uniref:Uncharacterized protein n=1 Tax=Mesorhizobium jarvisii TaxID=1777867 RepID=A0A6M7TQ57_9HYPH|nr:MULTISPECIES: hypothetical protein [Mesorhizobium]OBQ69265.1 hypothetical protein A9K72_14005 [Mesorhizobium loti]QKC66228.1 hypothetical protein EB229_31180 [Mesorhizobium jarvisii]QKD12140.1 hypothetical protein EFV37_31190 [Mesorhizobium loti]RJT38247.1 hypothetical protein D3242_03230 [Mesorhizobium jarvisii]BCH03761.1 hypothetical protein MesoLj131b_57600 [Mesorhizobium sp. 131-2-5]